MSLRKVCALFLMVCLLCSLAVFFWPVAKAQSNTFSIMQITDTQYLTHTDLHPHLFNDLTTWIAQNYANYNGQMVVHTGDIVNEPDNTTPGNGWNAAESAMNILTANNIPYTWNAGNHDQLGYNNPDSGWIGNQYSAFNPLNI
jgi:3',5'-cyclic AMP phosphodiesterase CpdA